jgi:microcystin-dependent protein
MEAYIGQIIPVAFNFAPKNWALCQGQILPISQNSALFSLLGTTYGGDGRVTFALPDLRGRSPIGFGQGNGLSNRSLGEVSGNEAVTLIQSEIPAHSHSMGCAVGDPNGGSPMGSVLANANDYSLTPNNQMSPSACQIAGNGLPHDNLPPYQVQNWIICLYGIFPPRD